MVDKQGGSKKQNNQQMTLYEKEMSIIMGDGHMKDDPSINKIERMQKREKKKGRNKSKEDKLAKKSNK